MQFKAEIAAAAAKHNLNPSIVAGLISIESNFNQYAYKPEANYAYLWNVRTNSPFRSLAPDEVRSKVPPADFPFLGGSRDQEWSAQAASWGLMQVMGAVARGYGFKGLYLSQLCEVITGLEHGCKHLAIQVQWAGGDYERALAAYNGGHYLNSVRPFRNAAYVAKVLVAREQFRNQF